ncbi:MAG: hypothetical protein IT384_04740 [Deltaproteobacteria bacterium]|nr:hypothetical protein [Deltaproteobacteria bacterium]
MGLFSSLFGKASRTEQFEEAKKARNDFLATASVDPEAAAFNAASALMLDQRFRETIEAYARLGEQYPERRGDCESQIGAAQYFLGELSQALDSYVRARDHGADQDMMDDNIWEVCEALHKKGDGKAVARYLELCPKGKYVKKARKLGGN